MTVLDFIGQQHRSFRFDIPPRGQSRERAVEN
jgi:hypothetical protein